jgi:hypothetical protein
MRMNRSMREKKLTPKTQLKCENNNVLTFKKKNEMAMFIYLFSHIYFQFYLFSHLLSVLEIQL